MTTPSEPVTASAASPPLSSEPLDALRDSAVEAGQDVASQLHEVGQEAAQKAKELGAEAQAAAKEFIDQGREQTLVWQEQLEQQIRQKPVQSLLVAGGIGVFLGLLLRR